MDSEIIQCLLIHGSIVILFGLLCGFPFWIAIIRCHDAGTVRAWRVAHTTIIGSGLLMLVVYLISPKLALSEALRSLLTWVLVVSGYGFVFALVIGAATRQRALTPRPFGLNTLLFAGHLVGAAGAIVAICIVLYGLL
jgi:uncharacterized membrane protein